MNGRRISWDGPSRRSIAISTQFHADGSRRGGSFARFAPHLTATLATEYTSPSQWSTDILVSDWSYRDLKRGNDDQTHISPFRRARHDLCDPFCGQAKNKNSDLAFDGYSVKIAAKLGASRTWNETRHTMIVVFAGSQPDSVDRPSPRLPEAAEEQLALRVRGLLQSLKPSLVVGALAAGSDIIFAESARLEAVPMRLLLPFATGTFRENSVAPHGSRWEDRFDRLVEEAGVETLHAEVQDDSYLRHNGAILDLASSIADETDERVWCIIVRPAPGSDVVVALSVTDDMAARAEGRGYLTLDIDPLAERPRAFVAMAYGTKFDPISKRNIDCDAVFHRIYRPLLEDLDLDWNRADLETDSGIIHVGMLDDLANSALVVADLTTVNFNVAYEVGIRHVFARRSTVLISPRVTGLKRSLPPFDVAPIRVHSFTRGRTLSDEEAESAIAYLKPILRSAADAGHTDSPVHEWFEVDAIVPPFARRSDRQDVDGEIEIRNRVRTAIKSLAAEPMLAAADLLATMQIDEPTRRALRIELAVGLLGAQKWTESLVLLQMAEPPVNDAMHRSWLHSSVMCLRRIGEHSDDAAERVEMLDRAEGLLRLAIDIGYSDSESYGLWGGLLKRKLMREDVERGVAAATTFGLLVEYYELGFRSDPQAYTGVNLVMALRVRQHAEPLTENESRKFEEALVVSRFLNQLDLERDAHDPWAAITDAELLLHAALWAGADTTPAATAYARASVTAPPFVRASAIDQLRFMELWGDPSEIIDPIISLLTPQI
jgi:hypothetical protein